MLVVSNTSPLSNLAAIGRLDLLREQLGSITIPPAVQSELARHPIPTAAGSIRQAIQDAWIRVKPLSRPVSPDLLTALDIGEAEAISLSLELHASLVLLDENAARARAKDLQLNYTGALGVLLRARQAGRIESLAAEIQKLRVQARFFISAPLEKALLLSAREH